MTWLEAHPRATFAVGVLSAALCAFAAGRYTREPAQVTEEWREASKEAAKTITYYRTTKAEHVTIYREKVTKPDGTVTERTAEHTDTNTQTDAGGVAEVRREVAVDTKRTTTARPDWRIGVLAGGTLSSPLLPLAGPLTVGAIVERRIVGPVSLGLWGLSSGQAGVALTVEF